MSYLSLLSTSLSSRYDPIFNFHYAKPINDIMRYRPHFTPFIHFSQYLRQDCQQEMLKRYYSMVQFERVPVLAQYYWKQRLMEYQSPLLFLTNGNRVMAKRVRRRYKRLVKERREEEEEEKYQNSETFLKSVRTEDLEESEEVVKAYNVSMESDVHDIYYGDLSRAVSNVKSKVQSVLIPQLTLFNRGERQRQRQNIDEMYLEKYRERDVWVEFGSRLEIQPHEGRENPEPRDFATPSYLIMDFGDKDIDGILKQYNSLNLHSIDIDRNSVQSKSTRQKHTSNRQQSKEQRLSTMSKSKKTNQLTSRKPTIKNIKVSEQYYEGTNPNTIQYKRMINIEGKVVPSSKPKGNRLSEYKISPLPAPLLPPTPRVHKMYSKEKDVLTVGKKGGEKQKNNNRSRERLATEIDRMRSPNGLRKNKIEQYEGVRSKAQKVEEEAMKALAKYRNKGVKTKSSEYLLKGGKTNSKH